LVGAGEVGKGAKFLQFCLKTVASFADGIGKRLQPRVNLYETRDIVFLAHKEILAKSGPKVAGKARHWLYLPK
jgi:hypothetical protein